MTSPDNSPIDNGHAALSESVLLKDAENALDEVCVLLERFNDRLALNNLALAKRYADGNINLLLEAQWGTIDFNIVFQREDRAETVRNNRAYQEWLDTPTEGKSPGWADKDSRQSCVDHDLNRSGCYRNDSVVFVQDIESVKFPQRPTPSLIWFKPKDEPLGLGADALYFGYATGFKEFGPIRDRKPATTVRLTAVSSNKIANKVVEGGSKIMNDIADDGAKLNWDAFIHDHAVDVLSSIQVYVMNKAVWCRIMEGSDRRLKVLNVAFGPFNF